MPLQHLEDAPRVLQRLVPVRVPVRRGAAGAVRFAAASLANLPVRGPVVLRWLFGVFGPVPVSGRR
jgi:hypothetical protein